ncbi:hypothetical protein JTB14_034325 [Gonioctena quinquepunctata]|nr:hypothetical protein JTB14_034325 [Gonioctena quinquepunctata]
MRSEIFSKLKLFATNDKDPKNPELKTLKQIHPESNTNNLIISRTDEENAIVILEKTDYISKVEKFPISEDFSEVNRNPTKKFQAFLKDTLNSTILSLTSFNIQKSKLHIMNPLIPLPYGLPKFTKQIFPYARKSLTWILLHLLCRNSSTSPHPPC